MAQFTPPPEGEKKEYKIIPKGTHLARCVSFIDIGTQPYEYQGETKTPRKVRIAFETPNETAVFTEEKGEQPFLVSTELTLSLHEKSNLFKMLSGWIGLTEKDKDKFDPEKDLLGQPCLISTTEDVSKRGNKFANIANVSPVMKGTECPEAVNKSTYFFMGYAGHSSEFDEEVFEGLPGFIKDKIIASPEWEDAHRDAPVNSDGEPKTSEEEILKILG